MLVVTIILATWIFAMITILSFFKGCNLKLDQLLDKEDEEDKDV